MKSTGYVYRVDNLGRIVIPVELREEFQIHHREDIEIFVNQEGIVLQKYKPSCIFCSNEEHMRVYKGKLICDEYVVISAR
ncbi:AbrB/MazE/SpoVT family DNA-binding domain-containing protein [Alicyclobacillus kakegawensis]|uniref:AbrB/MazE/SpoVT family DNA-binding domain-containing protein n=1 Tax=Alicyclobacillus kakegawensis TaxID=392012 RepID=UPI00082B0FEE|nr:AbrB/MazE/SpoVT family DNA-binding domain-containing protein [Alicyclobacillus kakegawensis]